MSRLFLEVTCAVIRRQGSVLLGRRADSGLWELPGGKAEPGETLAACLAREIAEELGARVEVGERLAAVEEARPDDHLRLTAFACRLTGAQPQAREHSELAWVPEASVPSLDLCPADRRLWSLICEAAAGRDPGSGP